MSVFSGSVQRRASVLPRAEFAIWPLAALPPYECDGPLVGAFTEHWSHRRAEAAKSRRNQTERTSNWKPFLVYRKHRQLLTANEISFIDISFRKACLIRRFSFFHSIRVQITPSCLIGDWCNVRRQRTHVLDSPYMCYLDNLV